MRSTFGLALLSQVHWFYMLRGAQSQGTLQACVGRIAQEANRKHDLSLVEYLVKEVFFYVGLEHLRMSIQLRRHPTIQARPDLHPHLISKKQVR